MARIFKFSAIVGIVFAAITGFIIFAIFSPYYKLKEIIVTSDSTEVSKEMVKNTVNDFIGKNILFIKESEIIKIIKEKYPELNTIDVDEEWPKRIEINVKSDSAAYNLFIEETANFHTINNNGIVLSNVSNEGLPLIKIAQYEKPVPLHKEFISPQWLREIDLAEDIMKNKLKLPVKEIKVLSKARELHLITSGNAAIWIDLNLSANQQLQKLILGEGKINLYSKIFDHIDLRIPKQIFWEWK